MRLHLGGHLNWYDPHKRSWFEISVPRATPLRGLLDDLGVPAGEIAVAAVNGTMVRLEDATVSDQDQVELFPAVGGG